MLRVNVLGGSGYTGGEVLRILATHPMVEVGIVTSSSNAGKPLHQLHPNLRGVLDLTFSPRERLDHAEVLMVCVPHGRAMEMMPQLLQNADKVIDLSADHRLRDPADYPTWYGITHPHPENLQRFVYGVPELHREQLRSATAASGPGCMATAANLAMLPLFKAGLVEERHIIVDVKIGSSAAGVEVNISTHHPERANVVRAYAPTGHRHTAEVEQELAPYNGGRKPRIDLSAHAVDMVRGILATCHLRPRGEVTDKDLWKAYRDAYGAEPFVRVVNQKAGLHQLPNPKVLLGSNFGDVGFQLDPRGERIVAFGAIDNLVKGAAGSAVASMNLMCGLPERTGLEFPGLHPV